MNDSIQAQEERFHGLDGWSYELNCMAREAELERRAEARAEGIEPRVYSVLFYDGQFVGWEGAGSGLTRREAWTIIRDRRALGGLGPRPVIVDDGLGIVWMDGSEEDYDELVAQLAGW